MKINILIAIMMAIFSSTVLAAENPLIGKWQFTKLASGPKSPENIKEVWSFSATKLKIVETVSGGILANWKYSCDTSVVPHRLTRKSGFKGEKEVLAIFKIVGEELHIAQQTSSPNVRPTKFTKDNTGIYKRLSVKTN